LLCPIKTHLLMFQIINLKKNELQFFLQIALQLK